ncbi:hypothetical protein BZA70DRAFT_270564 [Myxozyma melibiosi]|uniref:Uncharacterized protein n=1 Tax=Myxozyma melibiosi TaxID=54550 RepID=A0ABR1FB99_9ASCO
MAPADPFAGRTASNSISKPSPAPILAALSTHSPASSTHSHSKPSVRTASPSSASTAVIDDWSQFLDAILQELHCSIAKYGIPSNDFSVLSCGCVASEQWARSRLPNLQLKVCPNCGNPTELKKPVVPLRNIYNIVMDKRRELGLPIPEEVGSDEEPEDEANLFRPEAISRRTSSRNEPRLPGVSRLRVDTGNDFGNIGSADSGDSLIRKSSSLSGQSDLVDGSAGRVSLDRRSSSTNNGGPGLSNSLPVSGGGGPPSPKMTLVSLFSSVARQTFNNSSSDLSPRGSAILTPTGGRRETNEYDSVMSSSFTPPSSLISQPSASYKSGSGAFSSQISSSSSGIEPWQMSSRSDFVPIMMTPEDELREKQYTENYPLYRKDLRYPTQTSRGFSMIPRGKVFEGSAISPDTRTFALVAEKRWEVYSIPTCFKVGTTPQLLCVGKNTGEYGMSWDTCTKRDPDESIRNISWAQSMAAMSNRFLVIAGTNGVVRVHDLEKGGMAVFTEISKDPIRCVAISEDGIFLAFAVTSRDLVSGTEQPTIVLHNLSHLLGITTSKSKPMLIDMPYRDPLKTLAFSPDGKLLGCSTALESRFMVINLHDPSHPRLVIRSSRKIDPALESEGITCLRFFPGNRLMVVASVASDAHPIVVEIVMPNNDPPSAKFSRAMSSSSFGSGSFPSQDDDDYRIGTSAGSGGATGGSSAGGSGSLLQPKLRSRFHEVGSTIHQAAVSPRANSVALLDRNGTVYLTHFLRAESEHRRVVAVVDVTSANKISECASMRFSPDGQKLILVDRKGILYIEDFGAKAEHGETLKKCRIIK